MRARRHSHRIELPVIAAASVLCAATAVGMAADGPTKFSVAPDGRLLKDGQPYFFIGAAPGPAIDLRTPGGGDGWAELAAGGLNVVRGGVHENPWTPKFRRQFGKYLDVARAQEVTRVPVVGRAQPPAAKPWNFAPTRLPT